LNALVLLLLTIKRYPFLRLLLYPKAKELTDFTEGTLNEINFIQGRRKTKLLEIPLKYPYRSTNPA
jgi:hypothetical protein